MKKQCSKKTLASFFVLSFALAISSQTTFAQHQDNEKSLRFLSQGYEALKQNQLNEAVISFARAVSEDPANVRAQMELGYTLLKVGDKQAALARFERVKQIDPYNAQNFLQLGFLYAEEKRTANAEEAFNKAVTYGDSSISVTARQQLAAIKETQQQKAIEDEQKKKIYDLLERAYKLINAKRYAEAAPLLEQVIKLDANNVQVHKQLGYVYLNLKRQKDAIREFETVEKLDANDYQIKLQIGYLYDAIKEKELAIQAFRRALTTNDAEIKSKAETALKNLSSETPPVGSTFSEIYAAPFYQSRFKNFIAPAFVRYGVVIQSSRRVELYGSFRFSHDTRSTGGSAPQIFSDNFSVLGVGLRARPFKNNLTFYGEAGLAFNMKRNALSTIRTRSDFRVGVNYFKEWSEKETETKKATMPLAWFGDLYFDASYYSRFRNNVIAYAQVREGLRLFQLRKTSVDGFGRVGLVKDTRRDFYNNLAELGGGLRFTPYKPLGFSINAEYVRGFYFGLERTGEPNPYKSQYNDFRISLVFGNYRRYNNNSK